MRKQWTIDRGKKSVNCWNEVSEKQTKLKREYI